MDRLVSTEWVAKHLGGPDLRIVDCTVVLEFLPEGGVDVRPGTSAWETAHIPGSVHIDLLQELVDPGVALPFMLPSAKRFTEVMEAAGIGEGTRVVLYDAQMGMWAARMWMMLRAYGFDTAAVLDGGWTAWSGEGRAVAGGAEPNHAGSKFVARPRPGVFVGKDEVLAALDQPEVSIVNALEPESHRGERQDFPRLGHIAGSTNVPFAEIVDPATHRFLSPDALREKFAPVLSTNPDQVITYCGAGIAASSDAFALGLIGFDDVAIYDGSMAEWTSDPSLPMETGD